MPNELIRTWEDDGFRLDVFDTHRTDSWGKSVLAYRLTHQGHVIFEGDDFHCSPLQATDSDAAVAGLLGFLSLKPGDTDPEWFESYTPEQLAWCRAHGEHLALLAHYLESAALR